MCHYQCPIKKNKSMALYLASTLNYPNFAAGGGGGAPTGPAGGALAGTYPNPTLAPSGVTAGFYGSGTQVPRITVNAAGQVTNVLQVPIDSRAVFYPYAAKSTGAGDINLNSTDTFLQYLIGTSPTQIVRLPDTSTLTLGRAFRIQSYHNGTLLLRTFSDVQIGVLSFSGHADFVCVSVSDNSLSAWDSHLVNNRQNIQFGEGAVAIAPMSSAVGAGATAGTNSAAFGQQALAQGPGSCAFGQQATATLAAVDGLAFGKFSNASGNTGAMAIGAEAECISDSGIACGYQSLATGGNNALAFGGNSLASGIGATCFGAFSNATVASGLALGLNAVSTDPLFSLGVSINAGSVTAGAPGAATHKLGIRLNGANYHIPLTLVP